MLAELPTDTVVDVFAVVTPGFEELISGLVEGHNGTHLRGEDAWEAHERDTRILDGSSV